MRLKCYCLLAGFIFFQSALSLAGGEHQRRFAVELAIIAGDSRILSNVEISKTKRDWIKSRLENQLNNLPLLARESMGEINTDSRALMAEIKTLSNSLNQAKLLYQQAISLSEKYPLRFNLQLNQETGQKSMTMTEKLYSQLCRGCHLGIAPENSVVVGRFGAFARNMAKDEFLARLLGGLHGDAITGLENPFSDEEVALLFVYIRHQLP